MATSDPIDKYTIDALFLAVAAIFAAEGRPGGNQAAEALRRCTTQNYDFRHERQPSAALDIALNAVDAMPLASAICAANDALPWHYSGLHDGRIKPRYATKLRTAYLVRPERALAYDPTISIGLFLQEPGLDYPARSHAAEETFYVVSGTGLWHIDHGPAIERRPGDYIFHPSYAPHGSITLAEPILSVWRWTGNISTQTYKLAC